MSRRSRSANGVSLRRCIATGAEKPKDGLLRFVVGPDRALVPDIDERLPGRGLWLSAERDMVNTACAKGLFAKAARRKVTVPGDLAAVVETLLKRRCLGAIGMARRAGDVVAGAEKAEDWLRRGKGGVILAAHDGAPGGREKTRALAPALPLVDAFSAAELGRVLGRERAVHVVVRAGRTAGRVIRESGRLMAYLGAGGAAPQQAPGAREQGTTG